MALISIHTISSNHLKTGPFKIRMLLLGFQMFFLTTAICLDFKWLDLQILKSGLFAIQSLFDHSNLNEEGFQIPTVLETFFVSWIVSSFLFSGRQSPSSPSPLPAAAASASQAFFSGASASSFPTPGRSLPEFARLGKGKGVGKKAAGKKGASKFGANQLW